MSATTARRSVLGLGGCVDTELVWDSAALSALVAELGLEPGDLTRTGPIRDLRDLVANVVAHVRDGVGGERALPGPEVAAAFAARFDGLVSLGGTPVRAAIAMDRLGVPTTVHLVSIDDTVRRLLPSAVEYLSAAAGDSYDPHLIVQYRPGDAVRVGDAEVVARRANRLIYVYDPPNASIPLHPGLGERYAQAEVALVSGLNAVTDAALLADRLAELRGHLAALPEGALLVLEDAGYHDPALRDTVIAALADRLDVLSLNEDELAEHAGTEVDVLDAARVLDAVAAVHRKVPRSTVVVHTGVWAAAFGPDAARYRAALTGAVATAGARYRSGDAMTADDVAVVARSPRQDAGGRVLAELQRLRGVAVAGVAAPHLPDGGTTIGLGDTFVGGFVAALLTDPEETR